MGGSVKRLLPVLHCDAVCLVFVRRLLPETICFVFVRFRHVLVTTDSVTSILCEYGSGGLTGELGALFVSLSGAKPQLPFYVVNIPALLMRGTHVFCLTLLGEACLRYINRLRCTDLYLATAPCFVSCCNLR